MKKITLIFLIVSIGLFYRCESYLDVNDDPNYPTEVENGLVLPAAENYIAARLGEGIFNFGGFFAQYWDQAVEANQYNNIAEYNILQSFFNREYRDLYAGALTDLDVVRKQAADIEAWGDYLAATVLRAYTFQILVDCMDQAPYTEALQGSAVPMPKWDNGKDIYEEIISELDEALSKVTAGSTVSADLLLNRKINEWVAFANAMKLKLYMRSSDIMDNGAKIMELINSGSIYFSDNIKMDVYTNNPEKRNPWYECNWSGSGLGTINNIASYPIIAYLEGTRDPRISSLYDKTLNDTTQYKGLIPGSKTQVIGAKTKDYSYPVMTATTPVYFYTLSELNFFIAEAQLKFGNSDSDAKVAYEAAIKANFDLHGVANADEFISRPIVAWNNATTKEEKLKLIGLQKWVALCMVNHFEAWSEIRRLDYPRYSSYSAEEIYKDESLYTLGELIIPWVNYLNGGVVKRVPFPEIAVQLNNNTPDQKVVTTPVWWDVK
jgi:hypothetical protein